MAIENTMDVLEQELNDLYSTEQQLLDAQNELVQSATNQDLIAALNDHIEETETHISNLEEAFEDLEITPSGSSETTSALVSEGSQNVGNASGENAVDLAIGIAVVKAEALEMVCYESAIMLCQRIQESGTNVSRTINLLSENYSEDKNAYRRVRDSLKSLANRALG